MPLQVTVYFKALCSIIRAVFIGFAKDHCNRHAAALSYNSLLALAPLMAIAFSILSVFTSFEALGKELEDFIYQYLVPTTGIEVRSYLNGFAQQAGKLTTIGLISFFVTALVLLNSIENSLNAIWRSEQRRAFIQRMLIYWALVTLGPILMGASLSLSTYFVSLEILDQLPGNAALRSAFIKLLPVLFEVIAFFLLYIIMPNSPIKWRFALVGAVVAALLFELTKRGFSLFILNFNNYEIIYGALATLPLFLIWIYLSWLVTLLGAEVVAVLHQRELAKIENSE